MAQTILLLPGRSLSVAAWKQLYESAILELDSTKLPKRIIEARHAILDRAEEILTRPPSDERSALNSALRTLRHLMKSLREKGLPQRKSRRYQYFLITSSTGLVLPSGRTTHSPRHCAFVGRSGSPSALATGEYCPFCLHSLS